MTVAEGVCYYNTMGESNDGGRMRREKGRWKGEYLYLQSHIMENNSKIKILVETLIPERQTEVELM